MCICYVLRIYRLRVYTCSGNMSTPFLYMHTEILLMLYLYYTYTISYRIYSLTQRIYTIFYRIPQARTLLEDFYRPHNERLHALLKEYNIIVPLSF